MVKLIFLKCMKFYWNDSDEKINISTPPAASELSFLKSENVNTLSPGYYLMV